jgi:hypothetical protein
VQEIRDHGPKKTGGSPFDCFYSARKGCECDESRRARSTAFAFRSPGDRRTYISNLTEGENGTID